MQYNIYFRKENWDKFQAEENKSELINKLLSNHYTGLKVGDRLDSTPPLQVVKIDKTEPVKLQTFNKLKQTLGVKVDAKLCKIHGLPLDDRGRCLQKGCKYA